MSRQLELLASPARPPRTTYKTVSLWEPWATLMLVGAKRIETRDWWTWHRGPLLIHAARRWSPEQRDFLASRPVQAVLAPALGVDVVTEKHLRLGCVICMVNLVDCVRMHAAWIAAVSPLEREFGNYHPRRYGWITEDPRALPPFPVRGAQGIFGVAAALVDS